MRFYARGLLCVILELLVSAQCCVAFSHMSLVWRFVLFLVLLFSFLAIPIHLMMHKSLSPNQAGWSTFIVSLFVLCVFCWFGFVCVFCFLALVFVSVFLSAYDDDIGLCKGPPTARLLLIHLFTRWQNLQLLQLTGKMQHAIAC